MRRKLLLAVVTLAVPALFYACADDAVVPGPKPTSDATVIVPESGGDALPEDDAAEAAADAADATIPVQCTADELAANDFSGEDGGAASTPVVSFPTTAGPMQYAPNCLTIKAGNDVTFTGAFNFHPLEAYGGDPFPLSAPYTGPNTSVTIQITSPGTYGFDCMEHPGIMFGAVRVVP